MEIKQFVWGAVDSNSWLLIEDNQGLLIDAIENDELFKTAQQLESITIILTHSHFDHIIGLNRIRQIKQDATVISTKLCSEYLGNIYRNMSSVANAFMSFYEGGKYNIKIVPIICKPANRTFSNQMKLNWFGHDVDLSAVHGHSSDGLIALLDEQILFTGDTLLSIPTTTRFPTGNSKRFWFEDIPMLKRMNQEMRVYPGHGDVGKLREMLAVNKAPERYRGNKENEGTVFDIGKL